MKGSFSTRKHKQRPWTIDHHARGKQEVLDEMMFAYFNVFAWETELMLWTMDHGP